MTRARSGKTVLRDRKRLRKLTKGYRASRHNLQRQSRVTLIRAGVYAYRDRKVRKREFRRLWIIRVNAACRMRGLFGRPSGQGYGFDGGQVPWQDYP